MPPAKTKTTTRRRAAAKTNTARKSAKKRTTSARRRVSLDTLSPARQARLFRDLRKVMKAHGITGDIAAFTVTPPNVAVLVTRAVTASLTRARAAAVRPIGRAAPAGCPPGQVSRIVCARQADGTIVCRSECQPI